jgi:hypothetical protein
MLMNKHQSEKQREIMHRDYVLLLNKLITVIWNNKTEEMKSGLQYNIWYSDIVEYEVQTTYCWL